MTWRLAWCGAVQNKPSSLAIARLGASWLCSRRLRYGNSTSRWVTVNLEFSTPGPCRKFYLDYDLDRAAVDLAGGARRVVPPIAVGPEPCRKLFRLGRDWLEIQECGCFLLPDRPSFFQLQSASSPDCGTLQLLSHLLVTTATASAHWHPPRYSHPDPGRCRRRPRGMDERQRRC